MKIMLEKPKNDSSSKSKFEDLTFLISLIHRKLLVVNDIWIPLLDFAWLKLFLNGFYKEL